MDDTQDLAERVEAAGRRLRDLIAGLDDHQLVGPYLPTVNPMRWEIAHAAYFYELWVLRHALGRSPARADADSLFDSLAIPHNRRRHLPLPGLDETLAYCDHIHRTVAEIARRDDLTEDVVYYIRWSIFHEDMHAEALTYTRQTLGYSPPAVGEGPPPPGEGAGPLAGDVSVPGGVTELGAARSEPFVFDNEKWAHEVRVGPFAIARAAVSQGEFSAFVEEGGYDRRELWSADGWGWRRGVDRSRPLYWDKRDGVWHRRHFDRWVPLEPHRAMIHVSWYEADAYCRWAGRRLPTELEWEVAAIGQPDGRGGLSRARRRFPWGDDPPTPERANMDCRAGGCIDVGALPAGDSAFGCRQMIGNVWEWTSTALGPYPGFTPDMYDQYSAPWFDSHMVLRGGAYPTRRRLIRSTWRNFYTPDRADILAGFRTCALTA